MSEVRMATCVGLLAALSLAACSELATDGAEGAECVRSSQCQPGLACVPVAPDASQRMCSGDPSELMGEVPELEMDAGLDGGEATGEGGMADGAPTGSDSGPGSDAGPMGSDAGPAGSDAGPAGTDAGPAGTDAGPAGTDAGAPSDGSSASIPSRTASRGCA